MIHEEEVIGTAVECTVCGLVKKPRGRSASPAAYMCDHECRGYELDPQVGQLWPGETAKDFGYPVREYGSDVRRCCGHASDCAVHNAPALPAGKCDCGKGDDDKP